MLSVLISFVPNKKLLLQKLYALPPGYSTPERLNAYANCCAQEWW